MCAHARCLQGSGSGAPFSSGPLAHSVTLRVWPAVEEGLVVGGGDAPADAEAGGGGGEDAGEGFEGFEDELEGGGPGGAGRGSNRGAAVVAAAQWWNGLLRDR